METIKIDNTTYQVENKYDYYLYIGTTIVEKHW